MSAFFLSQQRAATAGCHQCRIPLCQPGSLGDCFMQSVACLEVSLSPPPWLFPGAKLGLGHFLPPVNAIHSSVPNKALLFCLMPWPLLWRTGPSPISLVRGVSSWLLSSTPHLSFTGFGNFPRVLWFSILVLLKMDFTFCSLF